MPADVDRSIHTRVIYISIVWLRFLIGLRTSAARVFRDLCANEIFISKKISNPRNRMRKSESLFMFEDRKDRFVYNVTVSRICGCAARDRGKKK